jgi:phosphoserine phosphatase
LSADELFAAVRNAGPAVVAFDCDGTLWAPDSGRKFLYWSLDKGLVPPARADWARRRYDEYLAGDVAQEVICGEMAQLYAGVSESQMTSAAHEFFNAHIRPQFFVEMVSLVAELHDRQSEIWLISSTNSWVVEQGAAHFRVPADRGLCTRVRIENGIVTDQLLGVPTGPAKVSALRNAGARQPACAFGNSIHDRELLVFAQHAFAINPDPELRTEAEMRGWPVFCPRAPHP